MGAAKKTNVVAIRSKPELSLGDIHDRLHDVRQVAIAIEAALMGVDEIAGGHNADYGLQALVQLHQEQLQAIMDNIDSEMKRDAR